MKQLAVLACWAACGARCWVTFVSGPRPIWRVSLTLSLVFVTIGATARYDPWLLNGRPGLPEAMSYFWLLLGVGMVNVYIDCLEEDVPTWRRSGWKVALGGVFATALLVSWHYVPNRTASNDLGAAPMSPSLAVFVLTAYVPIATTLARVSRYCFTQLRSATRVPAPGGRIGLTLIGFFCGIAMVNFAATAVEVIVRIRDGSPRSSDSPFISVTPLVNAISLCGLSVGLFFLLAGPTIATRRQRVTASLLHPLWEFLVHQHPQVHLAAASPRGGSPILTRMTMEVHDALSLCHLPLTTPATPEAIVRGIITSAERPHEHVETIAAAHLVTAGQIADSDLALAYNAVTKGDPCT